MDKNSRVLFAGLFFGVLLFAVSGESLSGTTKHRILVVYFSRAGSSEAPAGVDAVSSASLQEGRTAAVAKMIRQKTGGELFQIVTVKPYPADYRATTEVAREEQKSGFRPDDPAQFFRLQLECNVRQLG